MRNKHNFNGIRLLLIVIFFIQSCHFNTPTNISTQTVQKADLLNTQFRYLNQYALISIDHPSPVF